ncbi:MAG: sulfatase-like hydrolase/transferase [Chloroflexota bacterium]
MDTHWPFSLPNHRNPFMKYKILNLRRRFSVIPGQRECDEETGQLIEEMYDASIRRLDARLETLFDSLQGQRMLKDTYVFITSDHGEELLERGALDHQENVYQEVAHVPLIIKNPDSEEYSISESVVSLLDIPTTILTNESIPIPVGYEGVSIFQNDRTHCISETVVPSVNKSAKGWKNLYEVPLNQFIYAVRNKQYTVVHDKDGKHKFFDRKTDAQEKLQIEGSSVELERLIRTLKRHELAAVEAERRKVKQRVTRLKATGKMK